MLPMPNVYFSQKEGLCWPSKLDPDAPIPLTALTECHLHCLPASGYSQGRGEGAYFVSCIFCGLGWARATIAASSDLLFNKGQTKHPSLLPTQTPHLPPTHPTRNKKTKKIQKPTKGHPKSHRDQILQLGPTIQKQNPRYENCSHFWEHCLFGGRTFSIWGGVEKCSKNNLTYVPIYRVKYTESEYDIQNNNFFYKTDPKCQKMFEYSKNEKFEKSKNKQIFILYYV